MATKFALEGLTDVLRLEMAGTPVKVILIEPGPIASRIRVNAILPGVVEGDRIRHVIGSKAQARGVSYEEMQDEFLRNVSMRTMITPQQIADQILYLASPRARTISGQAISVCGVTYSLKRPQSQ